MGHDEVPRYMAHLQDYAAELTLALINTLSPEARTFEDYLDDGSRLAVTMRPTPTTLVIEFEAPPPSDQNHNAPRAVTVAAVLYVLRCLLGTRLPLNAGCLRPVQIHVPAPSLLSPGRAAPCAAATSKPRSASSTFCWAASAPLAQAKAR